MKKYNKMEERLCTDEGEGYVELYDGVKLYFEVRGVKDSKHKLLLITGFGAKLGMWNKLRSQLENRYLVCVFDNRGTHPLPSKVRQAKESFQGLESPNRRRLEDLHRRGWQKILWRF